MSKRDQRTDNFEQNEKLKVSRNGKERKIKKNQQEFLKISQSL
jgi:hypothetical protein